MRKAVFALVFLLLGTAGYAQDLPTGFDLTNYGVRIEPDRRLIVVLAALDAARTTNEAGERVAVLDPKLSPEGTKFRELLRSACLRSE